MEGKKGSGIGIVAFAFGVPAKIRPNETIAYIASREAIEFRAPVYTQWDIIPENFVEAEYFDEKRGPPPSTLKMARGAALWAKRHNFEKILVVAAKPHLWRCLRDLKYAVRQAKANIEIRASSEIQLFPKNSWFCSDSRQLRTRSAFVWQIRETIIRHLPMFLYEIVS